MADDPHTELVHSYLRVRNALGFLGMALPVILILGTMLDDPQVNLTQLGFAAIGPVQPRFAPSISDFYHTTYRDIFVGTLCAIGVFLITYRGYRRLPGEWFNDDWLATIAGLGAFGVALFPNESPSHQIATMTQHLVGIEVSPLYHYSSAFLFFSSLAGFCLYKFPRGSDLPRRRIYRFCGWTILLMLGLTMIAAYFKNWGGPESKAFVVDSALVFWFEAIGIWAFGLSWLTKGRAEQALVGLVVRRPVPAEDIDEQVLS